MSIISNPTRMTRGFTLLEILVALFIFSILSLVLASALRSVINTHSGTEEKAERLRSLQLALLVMSRDIEQAVNRQVKSANGKQEAAFTGSPVTFTFTHAGLANPMGNLSRSTLQRTRYYWSGDTLWRANWAVLDQAAQSQADKRALLTNIKNARFQYLDKDNHFQNNWPKQDNREQLLPKAVKITLTIAKWGEITQLYIIPFQSRKNAQDEAEKKPEPVADQP